MSRLVLEFGDLVPPPKYEQQIAEIAKNVAVMQQMLSAISGQVKGIEARVGDIGAQLIVIRRELDMSSPAEIKEDTAKLVALLDQLKLDKARVQGITIALTAIPKGLGWVILAIGLGIAYFAGKGHLP